MLGVVLVGVWLMEVGMVPRTYDFRYPEKLYQSFPVSDPLKVIFTYFFTLLVSESAEISTNFAFLP